MKTLHNYKFGESWPKGHINPHKTLIYRDKSGKHEVDLTMGNGDYYGFFRHEGVHCFLSYNTGLGYAGLQVFENGEQIGDIFLQCDYSVEEVLGRDWEEKSDNWIARCLYNRIAWPI